MADEQNLPVPNMEEEQAPTQETPQFSLPEESTALTRMLPDEGLPLATNLPDTAKTQLNILVDKGVLTPENFKNYQANDPAVQSYIKQRMGIEPDPALMQANMEVPAEMGLLQDTPLQPEQPVGTDTVLAPEEDREMQNALEEAEAAMALDQEMQEKKLASDTMAAEKAAQSAARDRARAMQAAKSTVAKNDAEAKQAVVDEDNEEGFSFAQAVGILLGGAKQGLIGGDNPALTMLDKIAERKEKKRQELMEQEKLSFEQKLARDKADRERLQFQVDLMSKNITNQKVLAETQKLKLSLQQDIQNIEKQQMIAQRGAHGLTSEELGTMVTQADREFYVRSPLDDRFYKVNSKNIANALTKELGDMSAATVDLGRMRQMVDEVGNNPITKVFDREMVAEAESLQQSVIGSLRVAIFGPGVITDNERAIAERVIRNPTKFMSIASANRKALDTIIKKVNATMRAKLRASGANLPKTKNEVMMDKLIAKYPEKYKGREGKAKAANDLIKAKVWNDYE